jgi:SAM-dependent methyltransferase
MKFLIELVIVTFFHPFYALKLWVKELSIYKRYPKLALIDIRLWAYYFVFFPFFRHTYQKIKSKKDIAELVYGETPYITFKRVLADLQISEHTVFYDLGCGQGKLVFYVALVHGVSAYGIDIIPTFIKKAKILAAKYGIFNADFSKTDLFETDLTEATIVYVTWTCFLPPTRAKLIEKLVQELAPKTVVITTSEPIKDHRFILLKKHFLPFSWGKGSVYVQERV